VINGCNIGLLNSGLEMKFSMAAIHCVLDENDRIIIDPDCIEEESLAFSRVQKLKRISGKNKTDFTFVFESLQESLISVHTNGSFSMLQYNEAQKLSRQACRKIFDFYAELVRKYANVI
jgi:exosome complex component RRP46